MKLLAALLLSLFVVGCLSYRHARSLNSEEIDQAVKLIEAQQGQGCICIDGRASPPAGMLAGTIVGTIGGPGIKECASLCKSLRQ